MKVCDQGKAGKLARRDVGFPGRGSGTCLDDAACLVASRSKDSRSLGGGSAKRSKVSLGWSNEKSSKLAGVSGLLRESCIYKGQVTLTCKMTAYQNISFI